MIPYVQNPMLLWPVQSFTPINSHRQTAYDQYMESYNCNVSNLLSVLKFKSHLQNYMINLNYANQKLEYFEHSSHFNHKEIMSSTYSQSLSPQSMTCFDPLSTPELPEGKSSHIEIQIKYLVKFFVNNYGTLTPKQIQSEKLKYFHDSTLLEIFNILISKYTSSNKTREEMVKWILRKALKTGRQTVKGDKKMNQNKLSSDLCKRYFKEGSSSQDEEEVDESQTNFLLPFRKNSKNKTMNANFISEIFTSSEFQEDYEIFLNEFEEVAEKELEDKLKRFSAFVIECVRDGKVQEISKYRRVPWLRVWIKNTKKVAVQLNEQHLGTDDNKKIKLEC